MNNLEKKIKDLKIKSEALKIEKNLKGIGEFHILNNSIEEGYCICCKGKCKAVNLDNKYSDKLTIISIKRATERKV